MLPAPTSAGVTRYVPTSVHVPPRVTKPQGVVPPVGAIRSSVTTTSVRFAVPEFVAVIVYVSVSPAEMSPEPSASIDNTGAGFTTVRIGEGNGVVSPSVTATGLVGVGGRRVHDAAGHHIRRRHHDTSRPACTSTRTATNAQGVGATGRDDQIIRDRDVGEVRGTASWLP